MLFCQAPVEVIRISTTLNTSGADDDRSPSPSMIWLVEGRPATLSCTAVGGYPPPRLQLLVDGRVDQAWPAAAVSTSSSAALRDVGGGRGLRVVTVVSRRWTVSYRPRPSDDGARLKCRAAVPGLAAVVDSVVLDVDCESIVHIRYVNLYPCRRFDTIPAGG